MKRRNLAILCILAVLLGAAASVVYTTYIESFNPKAEYEIEQEPIEVLYTEVPLDLGVLVRNASYDYDDTDVTAINVTAESQIEVGFQSVNDTHFSDFTVQIWNITETPTVVDSFNMTSGPVTIDIVTPTELGYFFSFTVAADAPYGENGIVELTVTLTEP